MKAELDPHTHDPQRRSRRFNHNRTSTTPNPCTQQHQRTGSEPTKQPQSVDQRSHQQLELAPDLNRTQSTKEREGKEQRRRRIYGSRPNPAASYQ
ncbi:hypothetical protein ACOSQ2_031500 [Xanthoceras sorbifolium]